MQLAGAEKPWVVVFSEALGTFVGCFTTRELMLYLEHAWSLAANSTYRGRFLSIVSAFAISPEIRFVPSVGLDPADMDLNSSVFEERFFTPCGAAAPCSMSHDTCWDTKTVSPAEDNLTQFCANLKAAEVADVAAFLRWAKESWSSTGLASHNRLSCALAAWVLQRPGTLLWPFPSWFSVSLLDTPGLTRKTFRRFLGLLKKESKQQEHYASSLLSSPHSSFVENKPAPTEFHDDTGKLLDSATSLVSSDSPTPLDITWPPAWMYTLDFWRRKYYASICLR